MGASFEFDAGKDDHTAAARLVLQTRTFAVAAFNGEEKFLPAINRSQCAIIAQSLSIRIDERIALNELLREREDDPASAWVKARPLSKTQAAPPWRAKSLLLESGRYSVDELRRIRHEPVPLGR